MWHVGFDRQNDFQLGNEIVTFGLTIEEMGMIWGLLGMLLGKSTLEQLQETCSLYGQTPAPLDIIRKDEEIPDVFVLRLWRQIPGRSSLSKTEYRMSRDDASDLWDLSLGAIEFDDDEVYDDDADNDDLADEL